MYGEVRTSFESEVKKSDGYAALVAEKVKILEQAIGGKVSHGSEGTCTSCGHHGIYDLEGKGLHSSSIYFSVPRNDWQCPMCDLYALAI